MAICPDLMGGMGMGYNGMSMGGTGRWARMKMNFTIPAIERHGRNGDAEKLATDPHAGP